MLPLAALAAIPSIFQGVQGITQMINGKKKLAGLERPTYEIPTAVRQQLALSRQAFADPMMPGEGRANSQIGASYSQGIRAARGTGNSMAGIAMMQANANDAYGNLATTSAQFQEQDRANLMSNLGTYASYQDQQWQQNKFAPYMDKYNEGREQIGAGQQNTFGSLNGLASVGMQYLSAQQMAKPVDRAQVQGANGDAQTSSLQNQFLSSAARLAKGGINKTMQSSFPGMTPAQLMAAYRNMHKIQ